MKCPFCQDDNDKVIDSRSVDDGFAIRRRRTCQSCVKRFTTFERVVELDIYVVKKDTGERQKFSPEKIRKGLERALWKRPIPIAEVEKTIEEIVASVYAHDSSEIPSEELGRLVMDKLMELDDVAYIRFASVYRQFKDIHDFVDEVRPMLDRSQVQLKTMAEQGGNELD